MTLTSRTQDNERDALLMRRVAARDRAAFEALYADYHRRLGRFLLRLTPRQDLIEEVVNDALWIVWQKAPEFRGASAPSTWIMGIAWRCALKALRRQPLGTEPLSETSGNAGIDTAGEEQERRQWILAGLEHLPLEQRTTLELAYYLGHSCEEIAEIMDCPVSTVKARMFHARVKLRNLLPRLGGLERKSS